MKLSKLERISLIQQHQILQKLHPADASFHEKAVEVLSYGYEYMYDELYQFIYDDDDIMSEVECKEVWETLSMFDSIDRTIQDIEMGHADWQNSKFFGYDGNNEGKFLGFAEFTINREGRFSYLPLQKENYFNSHMPARPIYQRMLKVWQEIDASRRFPMSTENLKKVLGARADEQQLS